MSTDVNVQEIIDRSDLSDSQKIGILLEKYALNPTEGSPPIRESVVGTTTGGSQSKTESAPRKIMTLTEREGNVTYTCEGYYTNKNGFIKHGNVTYTREGYYTNKNAFIKHGNTYRICHCNKCNGKVTIVLQQYNEDVLVKESTFRHGQQQIAKSHRNFIGKTQVSEENYFKNGRLKSRWFTSADNANIRIYKKYYNNLANDGREILKSEFVTIKVGNVFVKDGKKTWFYQTGRIKRTGNYKKGERIGEWKTVYLSGEKKKIVRYSKEGRTVGNLKEWYESGQLKRKENMLPNGVGVWYHENGQLMCSGTYKKNQFHGKWKYYNDKGKLSKEVNYFKGEKHGYFMKKNKNRVVDGQYKHGEKVGEWFIEYN